MNKKVIVLTFFTLIVLSTTVFATHARMSGLGSPYGLIEDDTDVFTYPATIFKYSGVAVMELDQSGGSTKWTMNANIPIHKYKVGVHLNRNTGIDLSNYGSNLDISQIDDFNFGFNNNFAAGLGFSIDENPKIRKPLDDGKSFSLKPVVAYHSFFGGYSINDLDLGAKLVIVNAKDLDASDKHFEMGKIAFELNGRKIFKPNEKLDLIAKAGFAMDMTEFNYKNLEGVKTQDYEFSDMMMDVGFSAQIKPNYKNRIILGITPIAYQPNTVEVTHYNDEGNSQETVETESNFIIFPEYNLALESNIFSWLTARVGAHQSYAHITNKINHSNDNITNYESTAYHKDYHMNLGLSFSFGNFNVDTVLEQELLFDGLNFLGGKSNGLAFEVSVKYSL